MNQNKFIETLATDLKPVRPLRPPWMRALFWFVLATGLTALVLYGVQEYRPGFLEQLNRHGRFQLEIASGLVWTLLTFYLVFASSIPGNQIHKAIKAACLFSFLVFAGSVLSGFWIAAPEPSRLGARLACELEVVVYGGLTMGGLFYLMRNGILVPYSWSPAWIGGAGGMISALLMQLACMYDPWHGLAFHFAPAVILGVAGWLLSEKIKTWLERKPQGLGSS